jgi:hypothetical protein
MGVRDLMGVAGALEGFLRANPNILTGNDEYLINKVNEFFDKQQEHADKVMFGKDLSVRVSTEGNASKPLVEVVHNETGKVLFTLTPDSLKGLSETWKIQGLLVNSKA